MGHITTPLIHVVHQIVCAWGVVASPLHITAGVGVGGGGGLWHALIQVRPGGTRDNHRTQRSPACVARVCLAAACVARVVDHGM